MLDQSRTVSQMLARLWSNIESYYLAFLRITSGPRDQDVNPTSDYQTSEITDFFMNL